MKASRTQQIIKTFTLYLIFQVPGKQFNRYNLFTGIIFQFPYEVAKGFWIVGLIFWLVSKLKLFQDYKVQPADDGSIPQNKILKVTRAISQNQIN